MKRLITILFVLIVSTTANILAQTPAYVEWKCVPPDSQNVSVTAGSLIGFPEIGSPGFVVRSYSGGSAGPLGTNQRWWPYTNGAAVSWGNEAEQVNSRYVQFAVAVQPGFDFHADNVSMYLAGGGTSMMRANVVFAKSAAFDSPTKLNSAPIVLGNNSDTLFTFTINSDLTDMDTLYVRVYPWYTGAPSTSKYLYIQDAKISGTTKGLSFPATATWPLSSTTTKAVTIAGNITAAEELFKGTEVNQYTGANGSQRIRMAGTNNSWPANLTAHIDTVYVQFAVSPKIGSSYKVESISFAIGAASTNYMKADIYYSKDPTFTEKTQIQYTTGKTDNFLISSGQTLVTITPNIEVQDDETFYLRLYPYHVTTSTATGKYMTLQNVEISGTSTGQIIILRPTVTTTPISLISTTSAVTGGTISSDGGAEVLTRGVCWNTTGSPTVRGILYTSDGSGAGTFSSSLTGLLKGRKYYVRAYATNMKGIAYGEEISFTTLDSLSVPVVTSADVTNILATTAATGGSITFDGGLPIIAKGACWNTTGKPTVTDNKTENGTGLESFKSILSSLNPNTMYYVRAYAENSKGVGYSDGVIFTTYEKMPDVVKIVSKDGIGDYTNLTSAFEEIPENYTGNYFILVRKGTYKEKLLLPSTKPNVVLVGEDRDSTILTYDDYAGKNNLGTSGSYSVGIDADDFTAVNITFQNTIKNDKSHTDEQAVALRVNGDRQQYYNCKLLGYQDTYYTWGGRGTGRTYMKNCYIEGSVDFIFGRNIVVFDSCQIHVNRNGGALTAASTDTDSKFGYVFIDNKITADSIGFDGEAITSFILGRPWQASPRTVFINCEEPASLSSAGWSTWNVTPALYAEYKCFGPGSDVTNRLATISRQLTDEEAVEYTLENIFAKASNPGFGYNWMPSVLTYPEFPVIVGVNQTAEQLPTEFALSQNYPNPFNPVTKIEYSLPTDSKVKFEVYDILGRKVATLIDESKSAGHYSVSFDASKLSSGLYIYRLYAADQLFTKKMMLLK